MAERGNVSKTIYVPEDCCFDSVDAALLMYPEDAVSLLVSKYNYDIQRGLNRKLANHNADLKAKNKDLLSIASNAKSHNVETTYRQYEKEHSKHIQLKLEAEKLANQIKVSIADIAAELNMLAMNNLSDALAEYRQKYPMPETTKG